jgi:hypothetical protein
MRVSKSGRLAQCHLHRQQQLRAGELPPRAFDCIGMEVCLRPVDAVRSPFDASASVRRGRRCPQGPAACSCCGGRRCAPTPLRCSPPQKSPAARPCGQRLPYFTSRCPGCKCRATAHASCMCFGSCPQGNRMVPAWKAAPGGAWRGRFLGRRAAQDWRRRAQRASTTDSPRLFERSERSERSEFRGATPGRAAQWSRRAAPTAPA